MSRTVSSGNSVEGTVAPEAMSGHMRGRAAPAIVERPATRIVVVGGARPNFIKLAPLVHRLRAPQARPVDLLLVHTGQHYDRAMSGVFFEQLGLPEPDVNLGVGAGSHAEQTANVLLRFEPIVREWGPDVVLVVGDVNSTLACALVAAKLGVKVAHVEAGLRSFDRSMPEEVNRILTDAVADYLFVTEASGIRNLEREGVDPGKVFLVGNVMIDSLRRLLPVARRLDAVRRLGLDVASGGTAPPFALVTLHRPSNVDNRERLAAICDVLRAVGEELPVIFVVHPRTHESLTRFGLASGVASARPGARSGVRLQSPVGYLEALQLMDAAALVLTDSGGIQEETTALGVPCLTLRETTERPVTVDEGTNTLVSADPRSVVREVRRVLAGTGKRGRIPPLWDGRAAERVVRILLDALRPTADGARVAGAGQRAVGEAWAR